MTAPFPPPRVKNPKNVTARELMGYDDTLIPETPGEPETPGGPPEPITVTLPFQNGGDVDVMLAPGSDPVDPGWPVERYDARGQNQVRVVTTVEDVGATGAKIVATYSQDGSSFATPGASSAEVAVSVATTGAHPAEDVGWVDLTPNATADRLWKLAHAGGDATTSPAFSGTHLQFRQKTATKPPRATPPDSDLPQGEWGTIIFDANAPAETGFADDDDVPVFTDQIAGNSPTSAAELLLPKYKTAGFNGSRPCVEWAGANVKLTTPNNPSQPYGSYTYYFVLENLDGGDGARILGAGLFDTFAWAFDYDDSHIIITNNGGYGALTVTDDWGMADAHIYRLVKYSAGSSVHLFVDGVHKGQALAAPQQNNGGEAVMMDYGSGIGLAGRIGRVVAYDQAHLSPTNTGSAANGLTGPEIALKAFWGTP